jgi:hypothetical protein
MVPVVVAVVKSELLPTTHRVDFLLPAVAGVLLPSVAMAEMVV